MLEWLIEHSLLWALRKSVRVCGTASRFVGYAAYPQLLVYQGRSGWVAVLKSPTIWGLLFPNC
jgi:hypothetical protein